MSVPFVIVLVQICFHLPELYTLQVCNSPKVMIFLNKLLHLSITMIWERDSLVEAEAYTKGTSRGRTFAPKEI